MSLTLKFVKGAHLASYNIKEKHRNNEECDRHTVQVHQVLRITSANKPPTTHQPTFDLKLGDLASVRRIVITAPSNGASTTVCANDKSTLDAMAFDQPLLLPASLVSIEVIGGKFSYPHSMVSLPLYPDKSKPFGWIQVDFASGPVTVELFSAFAAPLGTYKVYDGQAFDIASYVMYEYETNALDEELLASSVGGGSFQVLETGDGTSGNGH